MPEGSGRSRRRAASTGTTINNTNTLKGGNVSIGDVGSNNTTSSSSNSVSTSGKSKGTLNANKTAMMAPMMTPMMENKPASERKPMMAIMRLRKKLKETEKGSPERRALRNKIRKARGKAPRPVKGSAGVASTGMGSTGMGSTSMGSTGMGSTGMGSTGMMATGMGSTGSNNNQKTRTQRAIARINTKLKATNLTALQKYRLRKRKAKLAGKPAPKRPVALRMMGNNKK